MRRRHPTPISRLVKPRDPKLRETLERLNRWPSLRKYWEDKLVLIWSGENAGWWRPHAAGYTLDREQAGVYPFHRAIKVCGHAGPEKLISIVLHAPLPDQPAEEPPAPEPPLSKSEIKHILSTPEGLRCLADYWNIQATLFGAVETDILTANALSKAARYEMLADQAQIAQDNGD